MTALTDRILILGCGCFGVSTAYHLLKRGYSNVVILDRSAELPAPDAASNDLNRRLARDAISLWKNTHEWGDAYHESGVVVLGSSGNSDSEYATESYSNDLALGANVELLQTSEAIRSVFPPVVHAPVFEGKFSYLNRDGGWADAGKGLKLLLNRVIQLGAQVFPGKEVEAFIRRENGRTTGVQCVGGDRYSADLIVVATGSWTPSAFPGLNLNGACLATGQCVAMVQLTTKEAVQFQDCPVVLDFSSGFYVFPPNQDNIVKVAIHSAGYTRTINGVSTPRTINTDPHNGTAIPKLDLLALREELRNVYPDLAEKPFSSTRFCWYNDSPDGDWVISRCPGDVGLVLATAGSGHAFKFLPNIGGVVADLIENKLRPDLVQKFAVDRPQNKADLSRKGQTQELDLASLCNEADFLP